MGVLFILFVQGQNKSWQNFLRSFSNCRLTTKASEPLADYAIETRLFVLIFPSMYNLPYIIIKHLMVSYPVLPPHLSPESAENFLMTLDKNIADRVLYPEKIFVIVYS